MKKKPNPIDAIFQESFEDFTPTPSNLVWSGLQEQLLEKKTQERRRRNIFLWMLSGIILGSLVIFNFYFQKPNNQSFTPNKATIKSIEKQQTNLPFKIENKSLKTPLEAVVQNSLPNTINTQTTATQTNVKASKQAPKIVTYKNTRNTTTLNSIKNEVLHNLSVSIPFAHSSEAKDTTNQSIIQTKQNLITALEIPQISTLEIPKTELSTKEISLSKPSFWKRFSIAPWISNSHFDRTLKSNPNITGNSIDFFNQHESESKAWSYGMQVGVDLKKGWRIESGLALLRFQMQTTYTASAVFTGNPTFEAFIFTSFNTNNIQFELTNKTALEVNDIVHIDMNLRQEIRWLNVPLMASYRMQKGRLKLSAAAGLTANFFLNNHLLLKVPPTNVTSFQHTFSESSSKTHLAYRGTIDLHFQSNANTSIFLGFHYQNAFTSANQQKAVHFYPSMWGWQLGVEYRLF